MQIIGILKEHQAGLPAAKLCRKYRISDATFYNGRSKYGGMEASEAKRLRAIEDDKKKLKKLLAGSMLDVTTLKELQWIVHRDGSETVTSGQNLT